MEMHKKHDEGYPRRIGDRILDQSWREAPFVPRILPISALDRLEQLLSMGKVTQRQAAQALGVSEFELCEWLVSHRWQPTDQTRRAIHAWADQMWAADRVVRRLRVMG